MKRRANLSHLRGTAEGIVRFLGLLSGARRVKIVHVEPERRVDLIAAPLLQRLKLVHHRRPPEACRQRGSREGHEAVSQPVQELNVDSAAGRVELREPCCSGGRPDIGHFGRPEAAQPHPIVHGAHRLKHVEDPYAEFRGHLFQHGRRNGLEGDGFDFHHVYDDIGLVEFNIVAAEHGLAAAAESKSDLGHQPGVPRPHE